MSAFIALVAFDGTPVDAGIVDRMLDAARVRGGDRRGVWIDGTTALGQCERAVTPGAARLQPCANEEGTVRLVLDGRFDNVADLTGAFTAAGLPLRGCSDVELLLQAYELWGQDCAEHLIGDFAFAIWDSRRRALVCARDVLGTRPLYLHVGDTCIAAASEIAPLLRHPKVSRRPNEGYLAECLNGRARHPSDTVWQDVTRLEPAHALVAERGRVAVRRYWQPDPTRTISYRSDDEYAEHLAELIRVAVASRMRNAPKVGMMLSGGVDSSSIVGAIHELRLAGADQPLATFSLAAAGEPWDETPYLEAVEAMWPVSPRRLLPFEGSSAYYIAQATRYLDLPPYPNGVMANSLFDSAVESDTRVLLTGLWGDECLGTSFLHYADLIRAFQWRRLWSEFRANPDRADAFRPASLFRSTIWPLVPAPARQAIKNVLGRDGVAPWIDRRFAARVDLPARERPAGSPVKFSTMAKTDGWVSMTNGLSIHAVEAESRATAGFGLETRHPYGDRRILEFGYAIPDDQRWRPPYTKYVLRRAARGWLPDLVRDRLDFAGASSVVVRNVERQVSAGLWQNASIVRRGWVALPVLHAVYEKMMSQYRASDEAYERLALRLWFVCAVEIFMRYVVEERHD